MIFGDSDSYHLTSTIYSLLIEENGETMKSILQGERTHDTFMLGIVTRSGLL